MKKQMSSITDPSKVLAELSVLKIIFGHFDEDGIVRFDAYKYGRV